MLTEKSHLWKCYDCHCSHFVSSKPFDLLLQFFTEMPVQKKPAAMKRAAAMKRPAAKEDTMKSPAMKKPAAAKPKAMSGVRSGSNSPLPPYLPSVAEFHAALNTALSQPELSHGIGTPEMDPCQLAEMETVLDAALQEPGPKPAAKPSAADSPWTTQSSDSSDSSRTLELPGRDDWPTGPDAC